MDQGLSKRIAPTALGQPQLQVKSEEHVRTILKQKVSGLRLARQDGQAVFSIGRDSKKLACRLEKPKQN